MTVIQTVAGGAGGSGRVIDARNVDLASIYGSIVGSSTVSIKPYPSDGWDMEIKLGDDTIQVRSYPISKGTGGYSKYVDSTVINDVKTGIKNLLPDLPDGTYRIVTVGCGTTGSALPYWTLIVSGGDYSLSYPTGGSLFYYTSPILVKLQSIAKIS